MYLGVVYVVPVQENCKGTRPRAVPPKTDRFPTVSAHSPTGLLYRYSTASLKSTVQLLAHTHFSKSKYQHFLDPPYSVPSKNSCASRPSLSSPLTFTFPHSAANARSTSSAE